MRNPFNPLDWINSAQEWFAKTEKSSGFRPYLIFLLLSFGVGIVLLFVFSSLLVAQVLAAIAIGVPVLAFIPLFAWKAQNDPDFCRSETHVQEVKKIEYEIMGSESRRISAEALDQESITSATKEPTLIEGEIENGAGE